MRMCINVLRIWNYALKINTRNHRNYTTNVMTNIKTFVFLDCETTGLPYFDNNTTRITEICFVAVESEHISLGVYPRVMNKLSMCFNPQKFINPNASQITGLSNEVLQYQSAFSTHTVELIKHFLERLRRPVCFVAHNGDKFDYPILQAEIQKTSTMLPDDIICVDSLIGFRQLHYEEPQNIEREFDKKVECHNIPIELLDGYDEILMQAVDQWECGENGILESDRAANIQKKNETTPPRGSIKNFVPKAPRKRFIPSNRSTSNDTASPSREVSFRAPSFKLCDVYKRLTSKDPECTHEAEGDVCLLIHCAATLGEKFVAWANTNFRYFNSIPKMTPGKRIGT